MWTMVRKAAPMAAALGLMVVATGDARAGLVTFRFTASDPGGRTLSGAFSYATNNPSDYDDFRYADYLMRSSLTLQVEFEGTSYLVDDPTVPRGWLLPGAPEIVIYDGLGTHPKDAFMLHSLAGDWEDGFRYAFWLADHDATALSEVVPLPTSLDLAAFEERTFSFEVQGGPTFFGTIDTLSSSPGALAVPEPSLAVTGPAALLGLIGWRWCRRGKAVPA